MTENLPEKPAKSEIILYQTDDGQSRIQVRLEGGTVWLSQALMAELFLTTPQNITIHIGEIHKDGELSEAATCKEHLQVRQEGSRAVRRQIKLYNLDMILAVEGQDQHIDTELLRRFQQARTAGAKVNGQAVAEVRTVAQLLVAAEQRAKENRRLAAEKEARECELREREEAKLGTMQRISIT